MKSLKLRLLAFAAAATMLVGCSASVSADSTKANLQSAGYSCTYIDAANYKTPDVFEGLTNPTNLTGYLTAAKAPKDGLFAWFFTNIDAASEWFNANTANLVGKKIEDNEMAPGQRNNCVYVATTAAFAAAKIS